MRALVTGGAGFIGSAFCRAAVSEWGWSILNVDKLTYAGSEAALASIAGAANYAFVRADICDRAALGRAFAAFAPDAVVHFAAESHVDRSISDSPPFIATNIAGTHALLEESLKHYQRCGDAFRFLHVSTDEVFGSAAPGERFTEQSRYDPRSPYAASKAASDHLVRAWSNTFALPTLIANGANTYGRYQYPEKLIPRVITRALSGEEIPVYGDGRHVRDWLHVDDHVAALRLVLERGAIGESYVIGGGNECENLALVQAICDLLDARAPGESHRDLVRFVADRRGHDRRYALDSSKIETELRWRPRVPLEQGLAETVAWYIDNEAWWRPLLALGDEGGR